MVDNNKASYTSAADIENANHTVTRGVWRNDSILTGLQPTSLHNASGSAKYQRELLTTYFNNQGSVPWQDSMISFQ